MNNSNQLAEDIIMDSLPRSFYEKIIRKLPILFRYIAMCCFSNNKNQSLWLQTVQTLSESYPLAFFERANVEARKKEFSRKTKGLVKYPKIESDQGVVNFNKVPRIDYSDLNINTLTESMASYGALIVKDVFTDEYVKLFRTEIDLARAASAPARESARLNTDEYNKSNGRYYEPLSVKLNKLNPKMAFGLEAANSMLADSPPVFSKFISAISKYGIKDIIQEYLDGSAAMSIEKSVLRVTEPDNSNKWDGAWHQDGAFLGNEIHSLNMWIALSHCGKDAPSLDLITNRYRNILPTGTDRAPFKWSLGPDLINSEIESYGYEHLDFRAGDLIFFDHYNVHRTGMTKGMTKPRYAIESWFFSEYNFPETKTGLKL